jgi:hypothetical protein
VDRVIKTRKLVVALVWLSLAVVFVTPSVSGQTKRRASRTQAKKEKPLNELDRLRDAFIKATNEYKTSLEKLRASYEKDVTKAEAKLSTSKDLFAQGLVSKSEVATAEGSVTEAKAKVNETTQRMATADAQVASILLEADAAKSIARTRVAKGGFVRTSSYIRFNGAAPWNLSDAWKLQQFFLQSFKKTLPITVFGQGSIHNRWRLDHHNSIDVSLHPDSPEGQALLTFLRNNGIPFLAFRGAIPGTATGPHIHIGRPSHRY